MNCFVVDTTMGRTVREDISLAYARANAKREFGSRHFKDVHRATLDELVEIKRAGGWLPLAVRPEVEAADQARKQSAPQSTKRARGASLRRP